MTISSRVLELLQKQLGAAAAAAPLTPAPHPAAQGSSDPPPRDGRQVRWLELRDDEGVGAAQPPDVDGAGWGDVAAAAANIALMLEGGGDGAETEREALLGALFYSGGELPRLVSAVRKAMGEGSGAARLPPPRQGAGDGGAGPGLGGAECGAPES